MHGAEQESLSVQERFERTEITFTLIENGGCMPSGLGGRSFPVVWQADENLVGVFNNKIVYLLMLE